MKRGRIMLAVLGLLLAVLAAGCGKGSGGTSTAASSSDTAAAAPAATTATAAAASGSGNATGTKHPEIKIAVVTHGQAADSFWSVVKNGVDQAAKDMGVTVTYSAPDTFDMARMSQLIDAAVAGKPDGLVVSIPDANALGPSIKKAVAAGIPVISINSGSDVYKSLGLLTHIGQTEYEAGLGGGEKMAAAGVKNALCINQEVGNAALDLRCKGFGDALKKAGAKSAVVAVDLKNPTESAQRVIAAVTGKNIDGIMALGPTGATPALQALRQANQIGKIKLATFDLSPDVLEAIKSGDVLFAIDQQQYLQGYLPIVFLTQFKLYGVMPGGGGIIPTGPGFVTKDTAAQVIDLSKKGIR